MPASCTLQTKNINKNERRLVSTLGQYQSKHSRFFYVISAVDLQQQTHSTSRAKDRLIPSRRGINMQCTGGSVSSDTTITTTSEPSPNNDEDDPST